MNIPKKLDVKNMTNKLICWLFGHKGVGEQMLGRIYSKLFFKDSYKLKIKCKRCGKHITTIL